MATSDPSAPAPLDIREADRLYEPFPDFAAWKGLTEADLDLWDRFAKGLEAQRAAASPEAFGRAVEVAMRAAAIDTGAIEGLYDVDRGFTMSVATQAVAWEHAIEEKGSDVRALFEAQLEAYELVLDAVTGRTPVSEAWIRALHEKLCAAQTTYRTLTGLGWQNHTLLTGQYKTLPNHVRLKDGSFHAYAPVDRVSQEMHRLVETLASPEFESAHPILQASYAHYALVNVHPFADGNGRVARALASLYSYRAVSVPLVIFANQRLAYFDVLHSADTGRLESLIGFFRDRGIDTMQLLAESLRAAMEVAPEMIAAEIGSRQPPGERQLDSITLRLLNVIDQELRDQVQRLDHREFTLSTFIRQVTEKESAGQHYFLHNILYASLMSKPPAAASSPKEFRVWVNNIENPFRFLLATAEGEPGIEVRLDDVFPELAESFRLRLAGWVRGNLSHMLATLRKRTNRSETAK